MISMVATAQWDQAAWFGQEEHENSSEVVVMHTDISRAYFHADVEMPLEMWSKGCMSTDGSECVAVRHS